MAKSTANKLNAHARSLVRQWVVEGLTNGEIREGLAQRGYQADLTDGTFTQYRQDPTVKADTEAAMLAVRTQGMANRIRRVRRLHTRLMQLDHRINGTTAKKDNPDVVDTSVETAEVETGTFRILLETELKYMDAMAHLVDDPIKAMATMVNKDALGNATGTKSMELSGVDPELLLISARAQINDALEMALDRLDAEAAAEAAKQSEQSSEAQ